MPVQYTGILAEHHAVRRQAGLFDLCHMGQVDVAGPHALEFLQWVTTNDVSRSSPVRRTTRCCRTRTAASSTTSWCTGGRRHRYMVVVNASNRLKDVAWMQGQASERSELDLSVRDISDETGMIAIQGPMLNRSRSRSSTTTSARLTTTGGTPPPSPVSPR
jgi:aminomethyltransferase